MSSTIPGSPHPYFDEKAGERETRIRSLFEELDCKKRGYLDSEAILGGFLKLTHLPAHTRYVTDLLAKCDTAHDGIIDYQEFRTYVLDKEKDLWQLFAEINKSGDDYRLHPNDLENALKAAGIHVTNEDIENFMQVIDIGKFNLFLLIIWILIILLEGNGYIDFQDWRDFLLVSIT
jgi:solute carrier family 25 phosphate transporter 23/24/25/41